MNHPLHLVRGAAIAAALGLTLACVAAESGADTRSDYSLFCLGVTQSDPGSFTYPFSENGSIGTVLPSGGRIDWELLSDARMPGAGVPFLTQSAHASVSLENISIQFGPGCQFFAGSESRIVIRGVKPSAPQEVGTAPAQIRVRYHVILENEYGGTGATVGALNGIQISAPSQFESTLLGLADSGGDAVLSAPEGAAVTDLSQGALTRKEVEGSVVVNEFLSYGPGTLTQIGITFYSGMQAVSGAGATVTARAAALAGDTAVTDVVSLDSGVTFTVVPEPGGAALALTAIGAIGVRSARRRR